MAGTSQTLFGGMGRLTESAVLNVKNTSHAITARVRVPDAGANGVIISQGGAFGGWSLYTHESRPVYCYNLFGMQVTKVAGQQPLSPGDHEIRMQFTYDGGGPGRGGQVTLLADGEVVAEGRLERTIPLVFSLDETCDVGRDSGSPVSDDYTAEGSVFSGRVDEVRIELGQDPADSGSQPDEADRLKVVMARQ